MTTEPKVPITESLTPSQTALRGHLSAAKITMMVIAAAAPLTTLGGAVIVGIGSGNGLGLPLTFIAITIALLLFAVGFVAMTPYVKSAGAFFSYVHLGMGRSSGLGAGYVALLSYLSIEAGLLSLIGSGINSLLTSYGVPNVAWWIYALITMPIVAFFGHRNIDLAGKVLGVLLSLEILIVLVLDAAVAIKGGGPEGFTPQVLNPAHMFEGSIGIAIMFCVLSFIGFEAAAVFRDEAVDPQRTIPRATYTALIVVGVFYAVASWALISGVGGSKAVDYANNNTATMLNDVTQKYLGTVGLHVVELLFVTSVFACVLSFHNISARYIHALAGHGALPKRLGFTHERFKSPSTASLTCFVICVVLVVIAAVTAIDPVAQFYTWLGGITSVGVLLLMTLTCLSTIAFFRRGSETAPLWNSLIAPALGFLGLLIGLGLVIYNLPDLVGGSTPIAIACGVMLALTFVAGVVVAKARPVAGVE